MIELDRELFLKMNFDGGAAADYFFYAVSGNFTWVPLYVFILYLVYRQYGWRFMVAALAFIALTILTADQIANIFKYGIQKFRPSHEPALEGLVHTVNGYLGGKYGTVSAHAATVFSIVFFTTRLIKSRWYGVAIYLWALVVCYSRIYLGVHYPMDIVLGIVDAALMVALSYPLFTRFASKRGLGAV